MCLNNTIFISQLEESKKTHTHTNTLQQPLTNKSIFRTFSSHSLTLNLALAKLVASAHAHLATFHRVLLCSLLFLSCVVAAGFFPFLLWFQSL